MLLISIRLDKGITTVARRAQPRFQSQPEPGLDQTQIVQAALDLLNEEGLEGLSMRRLAEKLGIKAASLYWHVRDKEHLLGLLGDAICATIRPPDPALSWRERVEWMAHENRRVLLAYRDSAQVLASTVPSGNARMRLIEIGLAALLEAGLTPQQAAYAGFILNDYTIMFVIEETRTSQSLPAQETSAEGVQDTSNSWLEILSPAEYPSVLSVADHLVETNLDERFKFGVKMLLDGLERQLETPK